MKNTYKRNMVSSHVDGGIHAFQKKLTDDFRKRIERINNVKGDWLKVAEVADILCIAENSVVQYVLRKNILTQKGAYNRNGKWDNRYLMINKRQLLCKLINYEENTDK